METIKHLKKTKRSLWLCLAAGLLLLSAGLLMQVLDIHIIQNNKAVMSLSFIPLGLALFFGINTVMMKKNPKYMRAVVAEQTDERVTTLKQRADSITFRAMRWALTLVFFGYTFAFPAEIFESAGWWITFGFFFMAHMVQGIVLARLLAKDQ